MARYVKAEDTRIFAPRWLEKYPELERVPKEFYWKDVLTVPDTYLAAYYDQKGRLQDVLHMLTHERIAPQSPEDVQHEATLAAMTPIERAHYEADLADAGRHRLVYFIGPVDGPVKIGVAGCVKSRHRDLQIGSPVILHVWATCHGSDNKEAAYHFQFAEYRMHGEWFQRVPEIEAEIERLNATQPKEQP